MHDEIVGGSVDYIWVWRYWFYVGCFIPTSGTDTVATAARCRIYVL
jgi:hypothetical protein